MSVIRDLLYNNAINNDFVNSTLYNQTLLYKFILQHQPKYILHCGCPHNALNLATFIKENYPCEILHIKNWSPLAYHWLDTKGETPNPHQIFLDKITKNGLENHLVSFNSTSQTAYEVLTARHLRFDMLVSDSVNNDTDYIPLLSLIQKNYLHIRYVGNKKICDLKHEALFETNIEASFTYAQGYFITGIDYLSLYDEQPQAPTLKISDNNHYEKNPHTDNNTHPRQDTPDPIWTEEGFVYPNDAVVVQPKSHEENNIKPLSDSHNPELSPQEARDIRRQERRQAREERREHRMLDRENEQKNAVINQIDNAKAIMAEIQNDHINTTDKSDTQSTISATRLALRARRMARRMALINNADKN